MASEYKVLGQTPSRPDGVEKVTGAARYGADIQLPGLLHARVLRSPHPHARILRIDTSRAAMHPGVLAVCTAGDLPPVPRGVVQMGETSVDLFFMSDMVMARETVKWKGHPVAAVAAVSPSSAEEALSLIEVQYEPLPAVTHLLEAMSPESPLVHPELFTVEEPGTKTDTRPSNVALHLLRERGDVEAALAGADVVVERSFRTAMVHQGYIEPQSATASVTPDGSVTIWTTTQGPFGCRAVTGALLKIPPAQLKVVPMEVGGAFGGKIYPYIEPVVAVLSRKAGRPVKLTLSRAEVLQATGPTMGTEIRVKMGAGRDGKLAAAKVWLAYGAGAYPGASPTVTRSCLSPYRIDNFRVDFYDVVLNLPRVAAYRAPGASQAAFAIEQVVDELAQAVGMDPIAFRLLNASREGDLGMEGKPFQRIGLVELLETARLHPAWTSPLPPGPNRGRGVAVGFWGGAVGTSACQLTMNMDGSVSLITGSIDLTGVRAGLAQIAAEELGLDVRKIKPITGDTDTIPHTDVTAGSRTMFATGIAVQRGAQALRQQVRGRAAQLLEVAEVDVEFDQGTFRVKGAPGRRITVAEIASKQLQTGGPLTATGIMSASMRGGSSPGFSLHIADVEVDPDTGKTRILRYTAFQDVGKAVHPLLVEGQMQGGAAQGIGWALSEEYAWENGTLRNPSFLDYRMPVTLDLPNIECVIVEVPAPEHPYGVRGVGEVPIVPPPATLANALFRATGTRFTQLPMSPERVWRTMS